MENYICKMGTSRPRKIKAYTREDAIMRYLKSQNINLDHMGAKEADRFYTSVSCVSQAASALGKLGRSKNTEAQKNASRDNGKLGGRPKKDMRTITDLDGESYQYDNNSPISAKNPWSGAIIEIKKTDPLNLDNWSILMDDDLRDHLHRELAPCSDWDFIKAWSELVTLEEVGRVIIGS